MSSLLTVPAPLKTLFDKFPLKTYEYVSHEDEAMQHEMAARSVSFEGSAAAKDSKEDVFQLGVYQFVRDTKTDAVLASDPSGLFAQLSLCKRNNLKLPRLGNAGKADKDLQLQQRMCILSARATPYKTLPILVEGNSKRHVRSTESIHEILSSRIPAGEQTMYLKLMDTIVYDGYMTDLLQNVTFEKFCELYVYISERERSIANRISVLEVRQDLIRKNRFHLRHALLSRHLANTSIGLNSLKEAIGSTSLAELRDVADCTISDAIKCLERIQSYWQQVQKAKTETADTDFDYTDLALASYIIAISQLGSDSTLNKWLDSKGQFLVSYAYNVINRYL